MTKQNPQPNSAWARMRISAWEVGYACILAATLCLPLPAWSQRCGAACGGPESMLGLSEQSLIAQYPELQHNKRWKSGPRNSQGRWLLADVTLGAQKFDATLYVRAGKVVRVEYVSTADEQACRKRIVLAQCKDILEQQYGQSTASGTYALGGQSTQSLSFVGPGVAVALHVSESTDACTTRVSYQQNEERDASNL